MLTDAERALVLTELFKVLNPEQAPRQVLMTIFTTESQRIPGEVSVLLSTPMEIAEATITVCLRYGTEPPLLKTLLDVLSVGAGPTIKALAERVATGVDPNPDPSIDTWLAAKRPFLDRADLRPRLRSLVRDSSSPILRIHRPDGAFGRTYTAKLVEHVAAKSGGATRVLYAGLSPGTGPTYQATDLALDLLMPLGLLDDPPERTASNYPQAIVRWMVPRLMSRPNGWVIVLDGFGQPDLNPEVADTIKVLVATVLSLEEFRRRLRFVLIDYEAELNCAPADILDEDLPLPTSLAASDLEPALAMIGRGRVADGREGIVETDIPQIAATILSSAPASGKERLVAINEGLMKVWLFDGAPVP